MTPVIANSRNPIASFSGVNFSTFEADFYTSKQWLNQNPYFSSLEKTSRRECARHLSTIGHKLQEPEHCAIGWRIPGGPQWDEDVELYYFNARWYVPETGRFISEDPIRDGTGWNRYVENNPMGVVDPMGLDSVAGMPSEYFFQVYKYNIVDVKDPTYNTSIGINVGLYYGFFSENASFEFIQRSFTGHFNSINAAGYTSIIGAGISFVNGAPNWNGVSFSGQMGFSANFINGVITNYSLFNEDASPHPPPGDLIDLSNLSLDQCGIPGAYGYEK